jgi:hypothetical protein
MRRERKRIKGVRPIIVCKIQIAIVHAIYGYGHCSTAESSRDVGRLQLKNRPASWPDQLDCLECIWEINQKLPAAKYKVVQLQMDSGNVLRKFLTELEPRQPKFLQS